MPLLNGVAGGGGGVGSAEVVAEEDDIGVEDAAVAQRGWLMRGQRSAGGGMIMHGLANHRAPANRRGYLLITDSPPGAWTSWNRCGQWLQFTRRSSWFDTHQGSRWAGEDGRRELTDFGCPAGAEWVDFLSDTTSQNGAGEGQGAGQGAKQLCTSKSNNVFPAAKHTQAQGVSELEAVAQR
jgi:hypothetical protein